MFFNDGFSVTVLAAGKEFAASLMGHAADMAYDEAVVTFP